MTTLTLRLEGGAFRGPGQASETEMDPTEATHLNLIELVRRYFPDWPEYGPSVCVTISTKKRSY